MIICVKASSTLKSINCKWWWGEPSMSGSPRGRFYAQVSDRPQLWMIMKAVRQLHRGLSVSASSERCSDLICEKKGCWLEEWKQTNAQGNRAPVNHRADPSTPEPRQTLGEAVNSGRAAPHSGGRAAEPGGSPTLWPWLVCQWPVLKSLL